MKVDVYFSWGEINESLVDRRTVVVVDVIRATTVIVEALANGARGIFPTESTDEAARLASSLGREETLLCGERRGLKPEGFDLGNSPAEFTPEVVEGKQLIMSTTNGTRALLAAEDAARVLVGSFVNLSSVAEAVSGEENLAIVCAGREQHFALEDALCAGALLLVLAGENGRDLALNDAGRVALDLARWYPIDVDTLRGTSAGKALMEIGLAGDLDLCASLDRHAVVPEMKERRVCLPSPRQWGQGSGHWTT